MLDIATTVFKVQPSTQLLAKIREYHTAAQNKDNNNNSTNQEERQDGDENEDLDITNNKPSDELPKFEDLIEKLLQEMPDSDFKLEVMAAEKWVLRYDISYEPYPLTRFRLLKMAATYVLSRPGKALVFFNLCPQYSVDEKSLMDAGFVPIVQSIAGTQYVPTNTILLNNLSEAGKMFWMYP